MSLLGRLKVILTKDEFLRVEKRLSAHALLAHVAHKATGMELEFLLADSETLTRQNELLAPGAAHTKLVLVALVAEVLRVAHIAGLAHELGLARVAYKTFGV